MLKSIPQKLITSSQTKNTLSTESMTLVEEEQKAFSFQKNKVLSHLSYMLVLFLLTVSELSHQSSLINPKTNQTIAAYFFFLKPRVCSGILYIGKVCLQLDLRRSQILLGEVPHQAVLVLLRQGNS